MSGGNTNHHLYKSRVTSVKNDDAQTKMLNQGNPENLIGSSRIRDENGI